MYDFSVPNNRPGTCEKCRGLGQYRWGPVVNGEPRHSGQCHSCRGTGQQTVTDIKRNAAYNRHKLSAMGGGERG
jgi:DnaJ-class molecular chaperone